jgi:predicted TIM-barrel fold metal-dependent hydrolase
MTAHVEPVHARDVRTIWDGPIIDADVHVNASMAALRPRLDVYWREFMRERRWSGPPPGVHRIYPTRAPSSAMPAWVPADGRAPASDLSLLREHVLDRLGVDYAIANCYFGLDSLRHPDFTTALARAINDWLVEEWLERDSRLRASVVVPPRDPKAAIEEIERVGGHPGFVQALMPVRSEKLYGNRVYRPLLEAIAAQDLVFGLHFGGTPEGPPTSTGWPSLYVEEYAGEVGLYWAQVTSLIAEGAFQRLPTLRVAVLEGGWTWFPTFWWRLDKDWKGLRRDTPWVTEPPSRLIRERMRVSVAPVDGGPPDDVAATLRWLGTDRLLMFATDYPHWHDDDLAVLLGALDDDAARARLMAENARELYRL